MKTTIEKKTTARWILAFSMVMAMLVSAGNTESNNDEYLWTEVRHDSGRRAKSVIIRGQLTSKKTVARKEFNLDFDLSQVKKAEVCYEMMFNPYHRKLKKRFGKPKEGVEWDGNLLIIVNGEVTVVGSLVEIATKGWHQIEIDPTVLKKGTNTIDFTLDGHPGYVYLAIDDSNSIESGHSKASGDGGKTFTTETLNPSHVDRKNPSKAMENRKNMTQGEYMIRLRLGSLI